MILLCHKGNNVGTQMTIYLDANVLTSSMGSKYHLSFGPKHFCLSGKKRKSVMFQNYVNRHAALPIVFSVSVSMIEF